MSRRTLTTLLTGAATTAGLLSPASALAAPGPVDPIEIAQAQRIDTAVPFVSPTGEQLIFWKVGAGPERPMTVSVRDGGAFGAQQIISLDNNAELPQTIAFDPSGNAFVPFGIATNGALGRAAIRPARGLFGPAVESDPCGRASATAFGPTGKLALACAVKVGPTAPADEVVYGTRDGIGHLTPSAYHGPPADDPFIAPKVAWGADGTLAVAWSLQSSSTTTQIRLRTVSPEGAGAAATVDSKTDPGFTYLAGLAVEPNGTVVLGVVNSDGGQIYRKPLGGAVAAPLSLGANSSVSDFAQDAANVLHFRAVKSEGGMGSPHSVFLHTLPPGSPISAPIEIAPPSTGNVVRGILTAPDGTDHALIVRDSGTAIKTRTPGATAFGPEIPIADGSARRPQPALTPGGDVLVGWTRKVGPGDERALIGGLDSGTPPDLSALSTPTTLVAGMPGTFSVAATDAMGLRSVRWSFGDGSEAEGASASHAYASAGSYTVRITATDRAGNATSEERRITVVSPAGDTTPPALTVAAAKKIKWTKLRRRGITTRATTSEVASIEWSLVGRAKKAKLARVGDVVLARRTTRNAPAGTAKKRLKPKRSLLGRRRSLKLKLVITARDAAANVRTVSRTVRVRR